MIYKNYLNIETFLGLMGLFIDASVALIYMEEIK